MFLFVVVSVHLSLAWLFIVISAYFGLHLFIVSGFVLYSNYISTLFLLILGLM